MIKSIDNRTSRMATASTADSYSVDYRELLLVRKTSDLEPDADGLEDLQDRGSIEILEHDAPTVRDSKAVVIRLNTDLEVDSVIDSFASDFGNVQSVGVALKSENRKTVYADYNTVVVALRQPFNTAVGRARFARDFNLVLVKFDRVGGSGTYRFRGRTMEYILDALIGDERIEYAEPNYYSGADDDADDDGEDAANLDEDDAPTSDIGPLWNHTMIDLDAARSKSLGEGVVVAILDARCDDQHPALKGTWFAPVRAFEFAPDHTAWGPYIHHGTQCAGIVAGQLRLADGYLLGIAPKAKLLPVSINTSSSATYETRTKAINALAKILSKGYWLDGRHKRPIKRLVVNCSWQTIVPMPIRLQEAFEALLNAGAVVTCSAGNKKSEVAEHYPSDYPRCLSVGGVNPDRQKGAYSNYGYNLDLSAPGGRDEGPAEDRIYSLGFGGKGLYAKGTSFAAPHVAAVAALMWSRRPDLSAAEVRDNLIHFSVADIDSYNPDFIGKLGSGIVNAQRSVSL